MPKEHDSLLEIDNSRVERTSLQSKEVGRVLFKIASKTPSTKLEESTGIFATSFPQESKTLQMNPKLKSDSQAWQENQNINIKHFVLNLSPRKFEKEKSFSTLNSPKKQRLFRQYVLSTSHSNTQKQNQISNFKQLGLQEHAKIDKMVQMSHV